MVVFDECCCRYWVVVAVIGKRRKTGQFGQRKKCSSNNNILDCATTKSRAVNGESIPVHIQRIEKVKGRIFLTEITHSIFDLNDIYQNVF